MESIRKVLGVRENSKEALPVLRDLGRFLGNLKNPEVPLGSPGHLVEPSGILWVQ